MPSLVLMVCGIFLIAYGTWRSWANGRRLLLTAVDRRDELASRPGGGRPASSGPAPSAWSEVRHAAWQLALAVGWMAVAMLGLFMFSVAGEAGR